MQILVLGVYMVARTQSVYTEREAIAYAKAGAVAEEALGAIRYHLYTNLCRPLLVSRDHPVPELWQLSGANARRSSGSGIGWSTLARPASSAGS